MSDYRNDAQQRLLLVIEALAGHESTGRPQAAVAKGLGVSTSVVFRDLRNLAAAGWAEDMGAARWRLTPRATATLRTVEHGLMVQMERLERIRARYLGGGGGA